MTNGKRWKITLCVLAICLFGGLALMSHAVAAEMGMPKPTAKDKCPVCGMFVSKYPDWTMVVLFNDGSRVFFDGAKDMFKYLFQMKRYEPSKSTNNIRAIMVKDYYRLDYKDARKAWFVIGSDVYGPMGRELIPLGQEADAQEFMKDHKGKRILRFNDVTLEMIKSLD